MTIHRMPTQRVNHERPVMVIGEALEAANDGRAEQLVRQISEVHARQMGHLYGNRCPDLDLMRARRDAIVSCERELRALRTELAGIEVAA